MSSRSVERCRRLPPLPAKPPFLSQQQQHAQNASNSSQQGQYSTKPNSMTTPGDVVGKRPPDSGSSRSRNAVTMLPNVMEQRIASSPNKSEHGSITSSAYGSTTRSKQSVRSQQSAAAAQAQLEALDEKTARGEIESRSERNLFKMTGQIPPTGTLNEDEVYIRTEDLRSQCRTANADVQPEQEEPSKSPKKKLFQNLLNAFSKSSGTAAAPSMPSKAAQVLGAAARQPHIVQARPIKPSMPVEPESTLPLRPETAKSLPDKIYNLDSYGHRHHGGPSRRIGTARHSSPDRDDLEEQLSDVKIDFQIPGIDARPDSMVPPTPPAKDTPPKQRASSPLRRVAPASDLRQNYETDVEKNAQLKLLDFDLPPPSTSDVLPRDGAATPPRRCPYYNPEAWAILTGGETPPQVPSERIDSMNPTEAKRSAPLEGSRHQTPHLPPLGDRSEDCPNSTREQDSYSPLKPRFYSPKHPPARGFREGETPSTNTDKTRLLYSIPSESVSDLDESREGYIPMIFQGDPRDIDPDSPTARELEQSLQRAREKSMQPDTTITTRVMQELRINEQCDSTPQGKSHDAHTHPDMPHATSPGRNESHGDFLPHCLSAVPSPLHTAPVPVPTARPTMPTDAPFNSFPQPLPPKSIGDHFYMTNEHLDVVAKTTWDLIDMFNKQSRNRSRNRHDQLSKRFDEVKLQLDAAQENTVHVRERMDRVDSVMAKQDDIHATLDVLKDSTKEGIDSVLTAQSTKMASIEAEIKELKQMVQALQKAFDQKAADEKAGQHSIASAQNNTPNNGYPQGFACNHGTGPELGNMHDHRGMMSPLDSQGDARLGYQHGHQWATRPGYLGRNSKDDRPPYPTNPYHIANGGPFNAGYAGGYAPFGYSPGSPEQHYPFNNHGQAK